MDAGTLTTFAGGLVAIAGTVLGAYVAIRADLARLHERSNAAMEVARSAHERIDKMRCGNQ